MLAPPHALVECSIQTSSPEDAERLRIALPGLLGHTEGATSRIDPSCGRTVVGAADEAGLEALTISLVASLPGLEIMAPEVVYRETIRRSAEIEQAYKRVMGSRREYAKLRLLFEPLARGEGFHVLPSQAGTAVPAQFLPAVEHGLQEAREDGLLAGFTVTDLSATLLDGAIHEMDSSPRSFAVAARQAFRRLLDEAEPVMLEPMSRLDLIVPADCAEVVAQDLVKRRARDLERQQRGADVAMSALVPLATLFGYRNILRGLSQGRARRRQSFACYAEVEPETCAPSAFGAAMAMRA